MKIGPITDVEPGAVEALLDRAFGTDRHGRTAYRLRVGTSAIPELSFAIIDDQGRLAGTLQSWPVELVADNGSVVPMVMVGPVAVEPDLQQAGIGKQLMHALVDAADAGVADALMMIGDPEYYERFFGFSASHTGGWRIDGPVERRRLLARIAPGHHVPADGAIRPRTKTHFAQRERIA